MFRKVDSKCFPVTSDKLKNVLGIFIRIFTGKSTSVRQLKVLVVPKSMDQLRYIEPVCRWSESLPAEVRTIYGWFNTNLPCNLWC